MDRERAQGPPGGESAHEREKAQLGPEEARQRARARIAAACMVARYHGVDLGPETCPASARDAPPSSADLVAWLREAGLCAHASRMRWRGLMRLVGRAPAILLFTDGGAALLTGVDPVARVVLLRDPCGRTSDPPVPIEELRLSRLWGGEVLLIRKPRRGTDTPETFSVGWVLRLIFRDRRFVRDIAIASFVTGILGVVPPFLVMSVIDRVVTYGNTDTLTLLALIMAVVVGYEALLEYARVDMVTVLAARLDTRLNLHVFNRLLGLRLDYFERHPAGEIHHRINELYRVRSFFTGRLFSVILDAFLLAVLIPLLFFMSSALALVTIAAAAAMTLAIVAFLQPIRRVTAQIIRAEESKSAYMVESIHGIRTIKALAIEPESRAEWDLRVADVSDCRIQGGRLANWPKTLVIPFQRFMERGVILLGAYWLLTGTTRLDVGALVAFLMLGGRLAQPFVSLARLIQDQEEVRMAIGEVGLVVNNPAESRQVGGLRPSLEGALRFEGLTFRYPGQEQPALSDISFAVPAGAMLGVVGKSGSGKSTLARLLQGIDRDYTGFLRLDGTDLREFDLRHLRRGQGVVLQETFLFRGTVRENITAGRPGLTLRDVVRAARVAGAEEFIERLPNGFETFLEEGSTNLSGGQRQRLAIARAIITNPRLLIFDEATTGLDPESEASVNANLLRIAKDRTMVLITHRMSSLVACDAIAVLDRGRLLDFGPLEALLARCALFRRFWQQQSRFLDPQRIRHGTPTPLSLDAAD